MHMVGIGLSHNEISSRTYQSHYASSSALFKAINSDSIVARAIQVCLENFQDTIMPPRVKMYPLVDFYSSKYVIQFASLYPSSTGGYFSYLKTYSLVFIDKSIKF